MRQTRTGHVVWHDLFASDRQGAMAFYERVAGWTYRTEHATDFAWGGGPRDFVLALSGDEAGAGFVETSPDLTTGWIAYVEVRDVDASATRAEELGGAVVRQPFEVPGVGRNALLRDPLGALVGISLSKHGFPVPRRQFGAEVYVSGSPGFPQAFYDPLFGWTLKPPRSGTPDDHAVVGRSGDVVALHLSQAVPRSERAIWAPSLKVASQEEALRTAGKLGAKPVVPPRSAMRRCSLLEDPQGASFCLQEA